MTEAIYTISTTFVDSSTWSLTENTSEAGTEIEVKLTTENFTES
jgi:hypothetical protein